MLIRRQKYFKFCTPCLKTPQPILPYSAGWSNFLHLLERIITERFAIHILQFYYRLFTVHYFFPLFTNVGPYLIRLRVRSWESYKIIFSCRTTMYFHLLDTVHFEQQGLYKKDWNGLMLVSKENMRWYKDNNIKRAANKTSCFAVQWLNFPNQA